MKTSSMDTAGLGTEVRCLIKGLQRLCHGVGALRGGRLEIKWNLFSIPDGIQVRIKIGSHMI